MLTAVMKMMDLTDNPRPKTMLHKAFCTRPTEKQGIHTHRGLHVRDEARDAHNGCSKIGEFHSIRYSSSFITVIVMIK